WAYPHLDAELQTKAKVYLALEWKEHPPFTPDAFYPLDEGARREWHSVPKEYCSRVSADKQPHPFGNVAVAEFYSRRVGEEQLLIESWPKLKACFENFTDSGWKLDSAKGDLFANRYLASLLAIERIARKAADTQTILAAKSKAAETAEALYS